MLAGFLEMIDGGIWAEILHEMPEELFQKNFETLCHSALLSRNAGQAVAFLRAVHEKMNACKVLPEQYATLAKIMERAESVAESGGWQAVQAEQTEPVKLALPFPRDVFPPMLERYMDTAAGNVQVDRAMVGAAMLAACALCLQGRFVVAYPSGNGHREHLCLYLVIVGCPGERKSSAFTKAVMPVRRWQESHREAYKQELAKYETDCKISSKEAEAMEKQLGDKNLTDEKRKRLSEDLTGIILEQDERKPPESPEILATDTTAEALSNLMERTGETAGIFSDEADFLKILAGLYNKGSVGNLQLPLCAYDGSPFSRLRGSGTMFLSRPLLSICLFAQPALYEEIRSNSELQGRGLVGRLLFCVPEKMAGKRDVRKSIPIDRKAEQAYCDLLGEFLNTPQQPNETIPEIHWTAEAAAWMLDHLQQLEDSMQTGNPMENATDYASKAGGVAVRIAGILHMLWTQNAAQPITRETAERAVQLHQYFFAEKLEAMEQEESREDVLARRVLEKIKEKTAGRGHSYVSERVVHQCLRHTKEFQEKGAFEDVLQLLEAQNLLQIVKDKNKSTQIYLSPYA